MNENKLKMTNVIGLETLMIKLSNYFSENEIIPIVRKVMTDRHCWTDGNIVVVNTLSGITNFPTFVIVTSETYDKLFDD